MMRPRMALLGGHGGRSGVPRHMHQLCDLLGKDIDITVFSDVNEGGYDFAADMAVDHVTIPGLSSTLNPLQLARIWWAFCANLNTYGPFDLLWAHARLSLPMARCYVRFARTAPHLITTYHGSPFPGRSYAQVALTRKIEQISLVTSPPHDIVFLSQADRATFAGLSLDRHTVHEIANCSELGQMPASRLSLHPTLMMTTRASYQKNLAAAARIFANLPNNYRLILRGMGTDTDTQSQFLKILGADVCKRITFGGPASDVRPDLARSDCYLLTSRYEGMSIGALEAFEAGLPVAMPQIGGTREFKTHHPQSAIINTDDPVKSAETLHILVSAFRADRSRHIKTNHAAWVRAFHPSIWAAKIEALLTQ